MTSICLNCVTILFASHCYITVGLLWCRCCNGFLKAVHLAVRRIINAFGRNCWALCVSQCEIQKPSNSLRRANRWTSLRRYLRSRLRVCRYRPSLRVAAVAPHFTRANLYHYFYFYTESWSVDGFAWLVWWFCKRRHARHQPSSYCGSVRTTRSSVLGSTPATT